MVKGINSRHYFIYTKPECKKEFFEQINQIDCKDFLYAYSGISDEDGSLVILTYLQFKRRKMLSEDHFVGSKAFPCLKSAPEEFEELKGMMNGNDHKPIFERGVYSRTIGVTPKSFQNFNTLFQKDDKTEEWVQDFSNRRRVRLLKRGSRWYVNIARLYRGEASKRGLAFNLRTFLDIADIVKKTAKDNGFDENAKLDEMNLNKQDDSSIDKSN